jgi:simple sugar transport system permease protein
MGSYTIRLEKRLVPSRQAAVMVSVFLVLLTGAVFLVASDRDPLAVYMTMFHGAFGTTYGLSETLVKAIPLLLCGLGVALAFKMLLWNIG